jgi:transposase/tetratricopeptide (TPR) repeat protein
MKMYTASKFSSEKKLKVIKSYLEKGDSLRKHAHSLGISYITLWRWVQRYKVDGEVFKKSYKKSGKRFSKDLEKKIMMVKEQKPSVSIAKAQRLLKRVGIKVSHKGIWGVWRRYGLLKTNNHDPLDPFGDSTSESVQGLRKVKILMSEGNLKAAAVVLNDLPSIPKHDILRQIPEEFLSPRRRLERFSLESDKMPPPETVRKAHRISSMLEKKGYLYSSIFANLIELYNLHNMGRSQEMINILKILNRKLYKTRNRSWLILYYALMAMAFSKCRKFDKALEFIKKCRRLIGISSYPWQWMVLGSLHTQIGDYVRASHNYKMGLEMTRGQELFPYFATSLVVLGYCKTGDYINAHKLLGEVSVSDLPNNESEYYLGRAYIAFSKGDLGAASHFFLEVLNMSSKHNLTNHLRASAEGLAFIAAARNKKSQAMTYLKQCIPLLKKHGSVTELYHMKFCLSLLEGRKLPKIWKEPSDFLFCLLYQAKKTLKANHYRKAFNYAKKHGLLGVFERIIVFAPEPVLHMIEQGKDPGLSRAIVQFPLFNQKKSVRHIKFLGELVVSVNGHYSNLKLAPKERAFLIHLALKAGQPGKFILLKDIYHNFWTGSQYKTDHLSHMLTEIRKKLKIWRYFLCVTSSYGESRLINRGVYFTTDYEELEVLLVHAKALEKADDWRFALQDYMRVMHLFRGAPFEQMYDNWSEDLRRTILNQLEQTASNFAKLCLEHSEQTPRFTATVKKVFRNILTIIPSTKEIDQFLKYYN